METPTTPIINLLKQYVSNIKSREDSLLQEIKALQTKRETVMIERMALENFIDEISK